MSILEGFLAEDPDLLDEKVEEEEVEVVDTDVVDMGSDDDKDIYPEVSDELSQIEQDSLADLSQEDIMQGVEFAENADPRVPVMVLLDCSGSMQHELPMVDTGIDTLISEISSDELASRRAELSFVLYGTDVEEPTPFTTVDNVQKPVLKTMGLTATGSAILSALDALEDRKEIYKNQGVDYYRPIILLLTDGAPTETDEVEEASQRIADGEKEKKFSFFSVGTNDVAVEALSSLTPNRVPLRMKDGSYIELFKWLSASATSVSASQVGDSVAVPSPAGWASFD